MKDKGLTTRDFEKLGLSFELFLRYSQMSAEGRAKAEKLAEEMFARKGIER